MNESPGPPGPDPARVEELFARGTELPPAERSDWLARECAGEPDLRLQVESLLAAHDRWGGELGPLDAGRAAALLESEVAEPSAIGPYRVVRLLGRGGMGEVFLAERAEGGFEQRVALKLVKRGMDSEAILARFRQERQILARLEHPGIARLLDGGIAADGRPYFAMEFVDGEPITDFAASSDLGIAGRLDLFLQVCDAVQQAHRSLVVHRDLKPSNILVSKEGRAKLLDFGIAKVLASTEGAEASPATRLGARALTPEYASPEQVRGEPETTVSDVYALGVVLFELLTGALPYEGPLSTPEHLARAVCETDPPAASVAARRLLAGDRGDRVARRLRGDLDAILSRALAKEVPRRYPSVEALAEDLRRHRAGQPVQARPPGALYRAAKFARRHRVGVAVGASGLCALLLGLVGTAWQAAVASAERDRATAQAEKAGAVQDFLTSLLESVDPYRTDGAPWTAEQLLDRGEERLAAVELSSPEVEADLLGVLGGVSLSLGQLERAEALWRRAVKIRRKRAPAGSAELADGLRGLAAVLYDRDAHEEASRLLEEALAIERRRAIKGEDPLRLGLARTLEQLGVERHELGRHDEARALYAEALALFGAMPGDRRAEIAEVLINEAGLHQALGELDQAEKVQRRALAIEREVLGPRHPGLAVTLNNLAVTLRLQGDYDGAEELQREALQVSREALGDEHPEVSTKLSNLAVLLLAQGEFAEAAELFRQVLELDRRLLGERHVYVAFSLDNLASALAELGRFDEALSSFDRAHAILLEARGAESAEIAVNRLGRATALRLRGNAAAALPLAEQAAALLAARLGADHARTAAALAELAAAHADLGRGREAERHYRVALDIRRGTGPLEHPETVSVLAGLGRVLTRAGRVEEALELLEEAARMARDRVPEGHWLRPEADLALAAALARAGESERSGGLVERAAGTLANLSGPRAERLAREATGSPSGG